jgi:hypothetical protein
MLVVCVHKDQLTGRLLTTAGRKWRNREPRVNAAHRKQHAIAGDAIHGRAILASPTLDIPILTGFGGWGLANNLPPDCRSSRSSEGSRFKRFDLDDHPALTLTSD